VTHRHDRTALLKMPKDAEVELIKALDGQDPYAKAAVKFQGQGKPAIIADVLALCPVPAGRDAILNALPPRTPTRPGRGLRRLRAIPEDSRVEPAFMEAYKNSPGTHLSSSWIGSTTAALAQASANFYDAGLTDWLIKETLAAPDVESKLLPLESAFKVMPPNKKGRSRPSSQDRPFSGVLSTHSSRCTTTRARCSTSAAPRRTVT